MSWFLVFMSDGLTKVDDVNIGWDSVDVLRSMFFVLTYFALS